MIYIYGLPQILVTDNGQQFNNEESRKYCDDNDIDLCFTLVAHPQTNGQAEVENLNYPGWTQKKS